GESSPGQGSCFGRPAAHSRQPWVGRRRVEHVESLGEGTAPHTQLQVLLRAKGVHDGTGRADREAERVTALTNHQDRANVSRSDFSVLAGTLGPDRQAVMSLSLATRHGSVSKCSRDVIELSLVQLLINALTHVLKDDGDLLGTRSSRKRPGTDTDSKTALQTDV
uniref:Uncharacterized protein n=1 Tax=Anabas testudineus TaxID=64144 RepID=A0A3Q1J019_ANATE